MSESTGAGPPGVDYCALRRVIARIGAVRPNWTESASARLSGQGPRA